MWAKGTTPGRTPAWIIVIMINVKNPSINVVFFLFRKIFSISWSSSSTIKFFTTMIEDDMIWWLLSLICWCNVSCSVDTIMIMMIWYSLLTLCSSTSNVLCSHTLTHSHINIQYHKVNDIGKQLLHPILYSHINWGGKGADKLNI